MLWVSYSEHWEVIRPLSRFVSLPSALSPGGTPRWTGSPSFLLHYLSAVLLGWCGNPCYLLTVLEMNLTMVYRGNRRRIKSSVEFNTGRRTPKIYSDQGWKRQSDLLQWSDSWVSNFNIITSTLSRTTLALLNIHFEKRIYPWLQKIRS